MKNIIAKLFRYFGWGNPFSPKLKKAERRSNASTELIKEWVIAASKRINEELAKQIKANGFNPEDVLSGQVTLIRSVFEGEGEKKESYSIGNVEIMNVVWKENSFTIHVRPRNKAREIKKIITKGGFNDIIKAQTKEDIELEVKAKKMVEEFEKKPAPNLKVNR